MNDATVVRAITFPVVEPIEIGWKLLRAKLQDCWRRSTSLANWCMSELVKAERVRRPDDARLWGRPKLDLYNLAFVQRRYWDCAAWAGACSAANCVIRSAQKRWYAARYDVLWTGRESVPRTRYPAPFPIHNQNWKPYFDEGNRPCVELALGGDERTCLRLRGGPEMRRQLIAFRQLVDGAKRCEAAILRKGRDGHIMVKLVGHFEAVPKRDGHFAVLRTDKESFWVVESLRPWKPLNADHIRRWIVAHRNYLQRMADDSKHEKRWPAQMRENMNKARELRCEKQHNRLDTWMHQVTAMFVAFCQRQGITEVMYDDECQDFMPSFPWHQLKTKLAYKLDAAGITLQAAADRSVLCGTN